jgi:hypothetical protein
MVFSGTMSDKTRQLKIVCIAYMVIIGGYVLYGAVAKTGLYALLIDEQLKRFGKADDRIAIWIPFIVLLLPIAPLAEYVRKKERLARIQRAGGAGVGPHGAANLSTVPEQRTRWVWIAIVALAPFLISVVAYFFVTAEDITDQTRATYHMDLARSADLPAGDVKFIEIAGVLQQDSGYFLTEEIAGNKTGNSYAPLTNASWNTSQPVKYILHIESPGGGRISIGHFDKQTGRYDVIPPKGAFNSSFGGQLSKNGLADYVKSGLERQGIRTTDPYYVLDWKGDMNGPVASKYNGQMYYLIPFLGAFFSAVVLAGFGIAHVNRKRYLERQRN